VLSVTHVKIGTVEINDNPDSEKGGFQGFFAAFIPSNASPLLRCTQVLSILAYFIFPNSTVKDVTRAIDLFPNKAWIISGDPVVSIRFSCFLRGMQGMLAMFATLLLVVTSKEVVDVILNFTAINFISELDDVAFELAKNGHFGSAFQNESERIATEDLPPCMQHKKHARHIIKKVIFGVPFTLIFAIMICIISSQRSSRTWVTQKLRVQFEEESGLQKYSGCFRMEGGSNYKRRIYSSESSTFGYCRDKRQWILFKDNEPGIDPCSVMRSSAELAHSTKTETFDISAAFNDGWVSSSNIPIQMYFFEKGLEDNELFCDLSLGDGTCNRDFNQFDYQWDSGDCCSATCKGSNCGRRFNKTIFNNSKSSGVRFPTCNDPVMVPITIRLNDILSSRDPKFSALSNEWFEYYGIDETEWRDTSEKTPIYPYFGLECDGKTVLSSYITPGMANNSETVKVEDGANCSLVIRNTTRIKTQNSRYPSDPIWFVNYTIFHGEENETIEILTQQSGEKESVNFKRIPECFLTELGNITDTVSIYTSSGPSNQAVAWLVEDDPEKSQCEDEGLQERYALVTMFFAMNGTSELVSRGNQCAWPSIICNEGKVMVLTIEDTGLKEAIPSEIHLLQSLEKLKLSRNLFSLIPTEINQMTSLLQLDLSYNQIVSLPIESGQLANLLELDLSENQIESLSADNIGLMTSMQSLVLSKNKIRSLPSEIGLMTSIQDLILDANQISSLPHEIGNLTNMTLLTLDGNNIRSLPTEIVLMPNLQELSLAKNKLKFLPTKIRNMTSLQILNLLDNELRYFPTELWLWGSLQDLDIGVNSIQIIPKEIGLLTNMRTLRLEMNNISSLPSEIGLMTTLQRLHLESNFITKIPTEIGNMSGLINLTLSFNEISSIPTEIGLMTNLLDLDLRENLIKSLPSEIGFMAGLNELLLDRNLIKSLPTEIGKMTNMVKLRLFKNMISSLPTEIGLMTNVQQLDISMNYISSIPSQIGGMKSLEELRFDRNQISSVPTEIGLLTSLQKIFSLYGNKISSLPTEIGMMTSVKELGFAFNLIESIPTEIGQISNLQKLYLFDNKISSIPSTIGLLTNLQNFICTKMPSHQFLLR